MDEEPGTIPLKPKEGLNGPPVTRLDDFGLTAEDFERMGRTPLDADPHPPGQ
jgi:hypothetical protein